jgi:hypothetical protein
MAMSDAGPLRLVLRTVADLLIGLILFLSFVLALSAHERTVAATHRLGDLFSVSSKAGELLKYSLADSPLMAAAVVARAVPVPHSATFSATRHPKKSVAIVLLGGIFSMIVAFNLAFFRHLRREYASPR